MIRYYEGPMEKHIVSASVQLFMDDDFNVEIYYIEAECKLVYEGIEIAMVQVSLYKSEDQKEIMDKLIEIEKQLLVDNNDFQHLGLPEKIKLRYA